MIDVLETYYQLKESGQISETMGFFTLLALFKGNLVDAAIAATLYKKFEPLLQDWESGNTEEMWENYYRESFSMGHKVLLVSHSQGNLFAHRVYDSISPYDYRNYFRNLAVATPANSVPGEGGIHVTLFGDPIINPIPGSMPGNAQGSPGHSFIGAYLGQSDPRNQIVLQISHFIENLETTLMTQYVPKKTTSCMTGTLLTVKHRFDQSLPDISNVYFISNGELRRENGIWIKSDCHDTNESNGSGGITPADGIVTVSLAWNNPLINMNLEFTAGTKDIADLDYVPLEHYFVASAGEMPPETYPVHVTHEGEVDETCLQNHPETIIVDIKTPDDRALFGLDVSTPDELDIGHIADIVVSENGGESINANTSDGNATCTDCTVVHRHSHANTQSFVSVMQE